MHRFRNLFSLLLLAFVLAGVTYAQPSAAQAAAERYAKELIGYVTAGDRAAYRKFVQENFGGDFANMPMDAHLGFMSSIHDRTRGYEYNNIQEWGSNEVIALVKSKLTGDYDGLLVRVDANPPYKIVGLGLRPPKMPEGTAPAKKLAPKEMATELEAFVKKLAAEDVFSGSVLLAKDGQVLYKGAFGAANKDFGVPNKIDTKFNLGSMNKMFTAVAIAQLVEKVKI